MKKFIACVLCLLTFASCFTGCSEKEEVIKGEDVNSSSTTSTTPQQIMPEYDYKNLEASDALDLEPKTSYYISSYNEKEKLVFDDLCQKISECEEEISITRSITEERFKQMMNILLIDMPQYFHLAPSYSYLVDSNDNVSKVYPTYNLKKEDYKEILEEFDSSSTSFINSLKEKTQYDAEIEIINQVATNNLSTEFSVSESTSNGKYKFSGNPTTTLFGSLNLGTLNSASMSKLFTYYCRKLGIESSCIIGEITDNELKSVYGGDYKSFQSPDKATSLSRNGNKTTVSIDTDSFYHWNIVKINNKWYHVDLYYQSVFNTYLREKCPSSIGDSFLLFVNMPDSFASNSRLYHYNESVLGMLPSCDSQVFQYSYRTGAYFPSYNNSQIAVAINSLISSVASSGTQSFSIQMADQNTYDLFLDNFDKLLNQYNDNNKQPIRNYEIIENKASYSIIIHDINYN